MAAGAGALMHRSALAGRVRPLALGLLAGTLLLLAGCSREPPVTDKSFVGKWKSSRVTAPIHLHENGEWEIRDEDGTVLQYGVWQYRDKTLLWSHKQGSAIEHDANAVLSATPREFRVRERDKTTTTFTRLD